MYIIIVYCQIQFRMGHLRCQQMQLNYNYWKFLVKVTNSYAAQSCDFHGWT